jgi:UDP-GlcNAc:undecaprenyl-phosphate/decaprenyl-phosphate GlcNAc-1-phosphate transferase
MTSIFILFYFVISIISILSSIYFYKKLKIFDLPNKRKIHDTPVPLSGGFAVLLIISISVFYLFLEVEAFSSIIFFFYLVVVTLFLLGLLDELYQVNALKRLIATTLIYLVFFTQDIFSENDKFFLVNFISIELSNQILELNFVQSLILTIFCVLCFQNAMNMIDGLNGLSSMIMIIINLFLLYYSKDSYFIEINIFLIIFLIVYFVFNLKSKLFFGESGIYLVTFITSLLIIFAYKRNFLLLDQIILLLIVPGLDMIRVSIFRLKNKLKISQPDKNHIHHLIFKKNSTNACLILIFLLIIPFNILAIIFPKFTIVFILLNITSYLKTINYFSKS